MSQNASSRCSLAMLDIAALMGLNQPSDGSAACGLRLVVRRCST